MCRNAPNVGRRGCAAPVRQRTSITLHSVWRRFASESKRSRRGLGTRHSSAAAAPSCQSGGHCAVFGFRTGGEAETSRLCKRACCVECKCVCAGTLPSGGGGGDTYGSGAAGTRGPGTRAIGAGAHDRVAQRPAQAPRLPGPPPSPPPAPASLSPGAAVSFPWRRVVFPVRVLYT